MQTGRVLSDRYELVERLGSGGMAEVFRARDRVLERDVAVKLLLRDRAIDDDFVRRFRREARSAASLNHPNVVSIHDTGADAAGPGDAGDETHFIVMSLIDGPTLETVIAERAPFPIDEAVDIGIQVCGALEAAHAAGLVHRDIKPGNIMFDVSGEVKVTDFGIALVAAATRLTRNADIFGSASYLAPEQATGDDVDERADLYALGCVTYEMLTGRVPFTGAEPIAVVYQHLHGELEPPSAHRDDVPAELDAVVTRMLSRDREDRYATAREVREDLERLRSGGAAAAAAGAGVGAGLAATQRLEPPDETVAMSPARAPSPEAGPAPAAGVDADDRTRRTWGTGLAVIAALVLLAALLAATALRPDPTGDPGSLAGTPVDEPSPSPSPSPTPTPNPPTSLEDAVVGLYSTLVEGQQRGELSDEAADGVRKKTEEALDKYREGDLDEALKKLDEARREVDKLSSEGEIEPARADAVLAAIDVVEQALRRAAPPPDEDGGGEDDGEGNGGGNGGGKDGEGNEGRGNGQGGGNGRGDDD